MANTKTRDELVILADVAVETAVASLIAADNGTSRVSALRLLTRRMVRANKINRHRPRVASENAGAL
jgi:hypothetical protein